MVDFSYRNQTNRMIILRCVGDGQYFLERVVFPGELIAFLAPEDSRVEIWGDDGFGPSLERRIRVVNEEYASPLAA